MIGNVIKGGQDRPLLIGMSLEASPKARPINIANHDASINYKFIIYSVYKYIKLNFTILVIF